MPVNKCSGVVGVGHFTCEALLLGVGKVACASNFFTFFVTITIVKFRIPGYPGPSKELGVEVRLIWGRIFRGKIQMYLQLYLVRNYDF